MIHFTKKRKKKISKNRIFLYMTNMIIIIIGNESIGIFVI